MALLQWKDEYSVGIAAVDHEHRELIELINRLHDELSASRATPVSVEEFFGDLLKSISSHFALEERFMRDEHYDQLAQHKADHEIFHVARDVAAWSQEHVRRLAQVGRDYGLELDPEPQDESTVLARIKQKGSELTSGFHEPALLLLADRERGRRARL